MVYVVYDTVSGCYLNTIGIATGNYWFRLKDIEYAHKFNKKGVAHKYARRAERRDPKLKFEVFQYPQQQ